MGKLKIKGRATISEYEKKGNKWVLKDTWKDNLIAEKKHWEQWQKTDKRYGSNSYIKTRFGKRNDTMISKYTTYSPSKKEKVVYKIDEYFYE